MKFGNNIVGDMSPSGPVRLWDCQVEWASLQPEPGVWNFDKLDSLVNQAAGRIIVLVLGHPPAWAAKGGPDGLQAPWMPPGSNRPPASPDDWWLYIATVAQRYRGRITHYQIWNEPVDKHFYSGTYRELALYCRRAYETIKKIDPGAKVISPPLQPRRQAKWDTKGKRLIRALKRKGLPFDIYAAHIYPQILEGAGAWRRDAIKVLQRINKYGKKPLWITETNFNLLGPNNPLPESTQIRLTNAVKMYSQTLDIPVVFWYAYHYPNPAMLGVTNT